MAYDTRLGGKKYPVPIPAFASGFRKQLVCVQVGTTLYILDRRRRLCGRPIGGETNLKYRLFSYYYYYLLLLLLPCR